MKIRKGIPVNQGVVIGEAFVLDAEGYRIAQRFVKQRTEEAAKREVQRFLEAVAASKQEAQQKEQELRDQGLSTQVAEIFNFQVRLHEETDFLSFVEKQINTQYWSAEHAVDRGVVALAQGRPHEPARLVSGG